jgi:hypothetical protein
MDDDLQHALEAARTVFTAFQDQEDAAISDLDRLMREHTFVLEVVHLPDADPAEDYEDDGDDDDMLAACRRGEYACYRVTLHNEVIVLDEMCSWSKPGIADGRYAAFSLPDTMALDVADDFVAALREYAGEPASG